jgi:hypothetical protein
METLAIVWLIGQIVPIALIIYTLVFNWENIKKDLGY